MSVYNYFQKSVLGIPFSIERVPLCFCVLSHLRTLMPSLQCLDMKDVQLAYRLHRVVETGENWKMMGGVSQQTSYW